MFAIPQRRLCGEYRSPNYLLNFFRGISRDPSIVVSRIVRRANTASTANVYVCLFVYVSVDLHTHDGLFGLSIARLESHGFLRLVLLLVPRKLAYALAVVSDKSSDNVGVIKSIRVP